MEEGIENNDVESAAPSADDPAGDADSEGEFYDIALAAAHSVGSNYFGKYMF